MLFNGFPDLNIGNDWTHEQNIIDEFNYPNQSFNIGDEFTFRYFINDKPLYNPVLLNEGVSYEMKFLSTDNTKVYNLPYSAAISDDDTVVLNDYIPKEIKQSDIITDFD